MLLSDKTIKQLAEENQMVHPFVPYQVREDTFGNNKKKVPSYGLSTHGYDVRISNKWKTPIVSYDSYQVRDMLEPESDNWYKETTADFIIIPAHGFVLGVTQEYFKMPKDVSGSLFCKSTLARRGLLLPPTIMEAGWEGELVVEIYNMNPNPVRLYAGMAIGQVIFMQLDKEPETVYDGSRKYQGQTGVQTGKL